MTIKEARIAAGMTQKELAEAAGMHPRAIQKLESGEYKPENTTARNLVSIADALGVDPHCLI